MTYDVAQAMANIRETAFKIEVEVLDGGKMPTKAHTSDAGWDLYATSDITLYPGQVLKHPVNIKLKLPTGTWAEVTTKSGLGSKGQLVYAGVVDEAYRGIPHVIMTNVKYVIVNEGPVPGVSTVSLTENKEPIIIKKGEKLAQLIMNPYTPHYYMEQVESVDTNTDRGTGGFGSSGK